MRSARIANITEYRKHRHSSADWRRAKPAVVLPPLPDPATRHLDDQEFTFSSHAEMFAFLAGEVHMKRRGGVVKVTVKALAQQAGVCPSTVSNLSSGKTKYPRYSTIEGILRACGFEQVTRRR